MTEPEPQLGYLNGHLKRLVDVSAVVAISPFIVLPISLAAVAIKLEGQGDIFFKHKRVGIKGQPFDMLKLRTMTSTENGSHVFPKLPEDSRVTKTGKVLRRLGIDELPQIWNILKGDMSIFGIRPLPVRQFGEYKTLGNVQDIATGWAEDYCSTRPGGISLTTVRGRALLDQSTEGIRRKLRYDSFYINHASLCFDLYLLKESVKAFFSGEGAW